MGLKSLALLLFFTVPFSFGQEQKYWQQEVNYTISVTLDVEQHFLNGFETIEYTNNSSDTLHVIYMHLWPNAYRNGSTALAQQLYQEGNDILQNVTTENQGYIDSLDFTVGGESLEWTYDSKHIDIARLQLENPLFPGETVHISTPFRVKIPSGKISRLGHIGQSFQITQWYPKPAVYDVNGWNQMPYLNQGEFYSEYGDFDVRITLPKNYVVGATGDLQTSAEHHFLDSIAIATTEKLENNTSIVIDSTALIASSQLKTIRYTQSNVHDFAWFTDPSYQVLKGELELPHSLKKVDLYAMFTPQNAEIWADAIEYLHDGGYYYSLWNGDYPYQQITAVDGTISAGGGMEYPNVTVIGNSYSKEDLEVVIVHEVGHNWFYGILGSNERVHGWMDEGLNTLNEVRYIQTKYPENSRLADMVLNGAFNFHGLDYHDFNDLLVRTFEWLAIDQPIETHSAEFTSLNYGVTMYQKTGLVFEYLKSSLGDSLFDAGMQQYYATWKFKHPQPKHLQNTLEDVSGESLDWLFEELIKTTKKLDFKIGCTRHKHGKTQVKIKNKGQVDAPVFITATNGAHSEHQMLKPFDKKQEITFDFEANSVVIDVNRKIPEINRNNNAWHKNQFINRLEPLKIKPLFSYNRGNETNVNWFPALGTNASDRFMLGVGLHNFTPAFNPFSYLVIPMYSFGQNTLSGIAELSYSVKPKNRIKELKYGFSIKSFGTVRLPNQNEKFVALSPYTRFYFREETKRNPFKHIIHIQGIFNTTVRTGTNRAEQGGFGYYKSYYESRDHEFEFLARQSYIYDASVSEEMARLTAESTFRFRYFKKHSKWIEMRLFAGVFNRYEVNEGSANEYRYSLTPSGANGIQDIFVEEYFFNRNATTGFFGNQRMENQGGFKSNSVFGLTNSWLSTVNMFIDLPISLPGVGVFADAGLVSVGGAASFMYNTGVGVRVSKLFGIYFPLLTSENLLSGLPSEAYYNRIRFTLNMNFVNSDKIRKQID